jgi:hypothetical protein
MDTAANAAETEREGPIEGENVRAALQRHFPCYLRPVSLFFRRCSLLIFERQLSKKPRRYWVSWPSLQNYDAQFLILPVFFPDTGYLRQETGSNRTASATTPMAASGTGVCGSQRQSPAFDGVGVRLR